MKHLRLLFILLICGLCTAWAADQDPILPKDFGGWQLKGPIQTSRDPLAADAANAPLLKEYGFSDFASATYTRDDGRKLAIRAARFNDVSGAFGAYTFYYQPEMQREQIGDQAASFNQRILFYRGNVLIDAVFDRLTAMSAAELRELAGALPRPKGNAANAPPLLSYMPSRNYIKNTEKYVVGPIGLAQVSSPVPANLVDFADGTEVVLGKYQLPSGEATLTVISYPTPQIAVEHMKRLDAAQSASQTAGNNGTGRTAFVSARRSGPLLAVVSGSVSVNDARSLASTVNYDADVTWNQNTSFDKKNNLANLLVNIILLCGILIGLALVAGLAFGGLRIAVQRLFPGKVFSRPEEVDFIALHLEEQSVPSAKPGLSSSIKAG